MEIIVKTSDPEETLFSMIRHRIISGDVLENMLTEHERKLTDKPTYPSVMDLTFESFVNIVNCQNDAQMVVKWRSDAGVDEEKTVGNALSQMLFLRAELKRVKKAFDKAKMPKLTDAEQMAGFGNVNFGFFGIVDSLACRQGVSDEIILKMKLRNVIGKLAIIANHANCERRLTEIYKSKNK
jgi:hypothetical protein